MRFLVVSVLVLSSLASTNGFAEDNRYAFGLDLDGIKLSRLFGEGSRISLTLLLDKSWYSNDREAERIRTGLAWRIYRGSKLKWFLDNQFAVGVAKRDVFQNESSDELVYFYILSFGLEYFVQDNFSVEAGMGIGFANSEVEITSIGKYESSFAAVPVGVLGFSYYW